MIRNLVEIFRGRSKEQKPVKNELSTPEERDIRVLSFFRNTGAFRFTGPGGFKRPSVEQNTKKVEEILSDPSHIK